MIYNTTIHYIHIFRKTITCIVLEGTLWNSITNKAFHYDVNTTFGIHYSLNAMGTLLSIHYGYYGKDNNYTMFSLKTLKLRG